MNSIALKEKRNRLGPYHRESLEDLLEMVYFPLVGLEGSLIFTIERVEEKSMRK